MKELLSHEAAISGLRKRAHNLVLSREHVIGAKDVKRDARKLGKTPTTGGAPHCICYSSKGPVPRGTHHGR